MPSLHTPEALTHSLAVRVLNVQCMQHTHTHIHTHVHMHKLHITAMELKKGFQKEQGFQGRFERTDRGRMTDRKRGVGSK